MANQKEHDRVTAFLRTNQELLKTSQCMRDIYRISMDRNPRKPAMLSFDEAGKKKIITYAAYKNDVFVTASKLSRALSGVAAGTVIGLKLKNSAKWPVFFWAILMILLDGPDGSKGLTPKSLLPPGNTSLFAASDFGAVKISCTGPTSARMPSSIIATRSHIFSTTLIS